MNNSIAISTVSRQIAKTSEMIEVLSTDMCQLEQGDHDELLSTFEDLIFSELENLQRLTLSLTSLIAESIQIEENGSANTDEGDGSAFMMGELTHNKTDVE